MNKVGLRVKEIRQAQGVSVEEMARACTMRSAYVSDIEAGLMKASTLTYRKMADFLGVPLEVLYSNEFEQSPEKALEKIPAEYRFVISYAVRLSLLFGFLLLLFGAIVIFGSAFFYILGHDDTKFMLREQGSEKVMLENALPGHGCFGFDVTNDGSETLIPLSKLVEPKIRFPRSNEHTIYNESKDWMDLEVVD